MFEERRKLRVLVCGGRDYRDVDAVFNRLDALAEVNAENPLGAVDLTIIHGGATGADMIADDWAVANWARIVEFKANWKKHDKSAGPIRNTLMLDEGRPDLVLAFPGGDGTADMVRKARKAGVPVQEIK
jgi:hypothetical protein